ncbi:MAG: DUF4403 family protein [Cytophagales bacterium]|nr:DUF4403 family protein [Cytophagales bacterium]
MHRTFLFLLIFISACTNNTEQHDRNSEAGNMELEHATSSLTFPLDFPISDLSKLINKSLPKVLLDDTLNIKKGYVTLKVEPIGKAMLASYSNNLDVSIPMKVTVGVQKKVLGMKLKKPIKVKLRADMNTKLAVDENWNLSATCRIQQIHWIEPPKVKVLGVAINLQKPVDKKLKAKAPVIEDAVCEAVQKLVPLKKQVNKIWGLLGNTHRVSKKPIDIWLTSQPSFLSAHFSKDVADTLRVIVHTESDLYITPEKGINSQRPPLPKNAQIALEDENKLDVKVDVFLPYDQVNEILRSKLDGKKFSYQGAAVQLTHFNVNTAREKLHLQFDVTGTVDAQINAYALPKLGPDHSLIIDEIEYDITSDNQLMNLAKWIADNRLTEFLVAHSTIPLSQVLDELDVKIMEALNDSKVGGKVNVDLAFSDISSYELVFSEEGLQWIFDVDGNAHAYLTEHLVK